MATPQIPRRPVRSQQQQPQPVDVAGPTVPPRPNHRQYDRSESPRRERFASSPLNERSSTGPKDTGGNVYSSSSQNASSSSLSLPNRPPSVSLPSIGQEGNEYADIDFEVSGLSPDQNFGKGLTGQTSPTQTRNVGSDLPLHAPRPSLSVSDAKARVAPVTRTDSTQAAAVGLGNAGTPTHWDEKDGNDGSSRSKAGLSRAESVASTERPGSTQIPDSDHGVPEYGLGQRVPMYPNAGDVQAPSPAPFAPTGTPGIGFHNDATLKSGRHHGRTTSGREVFHGPPGSYGLHGHGPPHQDQFEKAWYDKHPEALIREEGGQYGPGIGGGRGESALSSEELNKIVRATASRGAGFGTSPDIVGLPNEQIGYMASEEYASRLNSPTFHGQGSNPKSHSSSQTVNESPLRKSSFPIDVHGKQEFEASKQSHMGRQVSDNVVESEDEVHIDAPAATRSKIGGNGYDPPTEDLGPHGGNTEAGGGWIEERGYGVPILASDEVGKEPGLEYLQPAIPPAQSRRSSTYYSGVDSEMPSSYQSGFRSSSRSGSISGSRPSSRPGSIHGSFPGLTKFSSHDDREDMYTPLEDVEEYEPLFPEEERKQDAQGHLTTTADRFKNRPGMKRRFPSQDIWEDTPNSLQLHATVSTPDLTEDQAKSDAKMPSTVFETPEAESARKGEISEAEKAQLMPKEERLSKSHFKPRILDDVSRPSLKQRFPSRDIWEDSPDSARLETTVGEPQDDSTKSPTDEGFRAGAVVRTSGRSIEGKTIDEQPHNGITNSNAATEKPEVPPRPTKSKVHEDSSAQSLPSIPARPPQRLHKVAPADIPPPPTKPSSGPSPTETRRMLPPDTRKGPNLPDRPKPQVPARPIKENSQEPSELTSLSKTTSASSVGNPGFENASARGITSPPPAPKPKPVLPSRAGGGKIASLKAGFITDLEKRLQVGPRAQTKDADEEIKEEVDKAPLSDARKGRAKGPARRKPAAPTVAAVTEEPSSTSPSKNLTLALPWTVWQGFEDGAVNINHSPYEKKVATRVTGEVLPPAEEIVEKIMSPTTPSLPEAALGDQGTSGKEAGIGLSFDEVGSGSLEAITSAAEDPAAKDDTDTPSRTAKVSVAKETNPWETEPLVVQVSMSRETLPEKTTVLGNELATEGDTDTVKEIEA